MQALAWQDSFLREGNKERAVPFGGVIFSLLPWLLEREGATMMLLGCFWNTECAHGCFLGPENQQRPGLLGKDMGVEYSHGQDGYACPPVVCCSVAKSCPTLCDPKDCSTPGFPVLHLLPEFAQTHVH